MTTRCTNNFEGWTGQFSSQSQLVRTSRLCSLRLAPSPCTLPFLSLLKETQNLVLVVYLQAICGTTFLCSGDKIMSQRRPIYSKAENTNKLNNSLCTLIKRTTRKPKSAKKITEHQKVLSIISRSRQCGKLVLTLRRFNILFRTFPLPLPVFSHRNHYLCLDKVNLVIHLKANEF
jgi:hypothetical protein